MSRNVLFVGYGGGHMAMLLPVMRALRECEPGIRCTLLALTTGYQAAVRAGEQPLGYKDLLHLVDADAALAWGERLLPGNSSPAVAVEESIAYLGINYLDLVAQFGEDGAAQRYASSARFGFHPRHFMRRVVDSLQPAAVIATNSPRSEAAALQAAVERGTPSIGMIDLFGMDGDHYYKQPFQPEWTCVIAESVRQRVISKGYAQDRVVVTGNPAFDGLFSVENRRSADAFLAGKEWKGSKVILWAGYREVHWLGQDDRTRNAFAEDVEDTLRALVAARPELALIVRYHPSEWQYFRRLADAPRVHFSVPQTEMIQPLILASDVVVVQNSTVGLEASVAGKRVISMEASPSVRQTFSYAELGVSTGCQSTEELPRVIDEVLAAPPAAGSFASDGRAAQRVAALISRASD